MLNRISPAILFICVFVLTSVPALGQTKSKRSNLKVTTRSTVPADFPRQVPNVDMNGMGQSDFVITRAPAGLGFNLSEGSEGPLSNRQRQKSDHGRIRSASFSPTSDFPLQWWTLNSEDFTHLGVTWGELFDWPTPADFDGDDKADIAVWRPGDDAIFLWINSSDSTFGSSFFGQDGDNPSVVGDYDGDNKADPAVYRCPVSFEPGPCHFYYRATSNNPENNITFWPFGYGEYFSVRPMPGDFDGDQKYDFCIYVAQSDDPERGMFVLQTSGNLSNYEYISYGLVNSDVLVPGDYDGDGRTDFGIARDQDGYWDFYVLERDGGGLPGAATRWGVTSDLIAPGDYDGDGKTDFAVYRGGGDGEVATFWVLRSSDGQPQAFPWGTSSDLPAASWIVQ